jgi:hypothetical protein
MRSPTQLDALIEELTVDCYNDEEQETGFQVGAEEALRRGERAHLAGRELEVRRVVHGPDVRAGLRAQLRDQDGIAYEVALSDLAFPDDSELGTIVAAYRRWLGWR